MSLNSFSIVIPTYNGLKRLIQNIPFVIHAAEASGCPYQIVVADDGSTDETVAWLKNCCPTVDLSRTQDNLGFIEAANRGVRFAKYDVVILLNNDVRPMVDCFKHVLSPFNQPDVFAVSFKSLCPDSLMFREGAKRICFRRGMLTVLHGERHQLKPKADGSISTAYPVGGHCAVRHSMFLELGGFDKLFAPFYWEDVDLGWRAKESGWQMIYEPKAEVIHDHEGTIKNLYGVIQSREIRDRNRLLFCWKHLKGVRRFCHFLILFIRIPFMPFTSRLTFGVLISAVRRWRQIG